MTISIIRAITRPGMHRFHYPRLRNGTRGIRRQYLPSSASSSSALTVGILRETYDTWERRTPLCPDHVQNFLSHHPESQVLVQPSFHRIFSNQAYEDAGASIQEDLSTADVILGVKRPKSMQYDHKMYAFFSHVIKGQPENMPLLKETLDKKNCLMDYECIVEGATSTIQEQKRKRTVAFGKYAGLAGMIDTFSILGRRLLLNEYSTPFLNCPPAIFHATLDDAKRSVRTMGEQIAAEGLPNTLEPLVFAATGPGGNVHKGVQEILTLLPHERVEAADLPQLFADSSSNSTEYKIYCVAPTMQDLYQHKDHQKEFDRNDFQANPHLYECKFADSVARYSHVLMNCVYWDDRFPRLLTKEDMLSLYDSGNERLMVVSDISCDVKGSIEFLERSTTIDRPCFQYDPVRGKEVSDTIEGHGITVMGVDILPTELPLESSTHFGDAVKGIIEECAVVKKLSHAVNVEELSPMLADAVITTKDGKLSSNFKYLDDLMHHLPKQAMVKDQKVMTIMLEGHLFDSGLINQVLDILDTNKCGFHFKECHVRHRGKDEQPVKSTAILEIFGGIADTDSAKLEAKIINLVSAVETADATFRRIDNPKDRSGGAGRAYVENEKNVLLLGSGLMAKSVVDFLGRSKDRIVTVASNDKAQARTAASFAKRGRAEELDVENDKSRMLDLINQSNVVISLLPAPMHPKVADLCIESQTDLVTASYESKDMQELGVRAKDAGITILNEVGLDPGLDHMSAMKIIDDIHDRGGTVTKFSSVCGGLPAPEAADNPLRYKFSWNPRGVISASQNDALYRWEGDEVRVHGKELLQSATPFFDGWKDLGLECLPNRDSLHYEKTYGIEGAGTLFRGTLRYEGFSGLMHTFQNMGLFDESIKTDDLSSWQDVFDLLRHRGGFDSMDDFLLVCAQDDPTNARQAQECLEWLGMMNATDPCALESHLAERSSVVDLFCGQLQEKLKYDDNERDMVIMHHSIGASFDDGRKESHSSSLQVFGDRSMTAMCKTVGQTAAASADLLLSGNLQGQSDMRGLVLPTRKEIYVPVLEAVKREGIIFDEKVELEQDTSKVA